MYQDNCGVVGICQNGNSLENLAKSLFHLQHRGQHFVGLAVRKENKMIDHETVPGLVKPNIKIFQSRESDSAIGHVSLKEPQPFFAYTKMGQICLAFSGNILNSQAIREQAKEVGQSFISELDVEVLTRLVGQSSDPAEGIKMMASQIKGAFSLVLLTENGLYASRDPFGFRPLIIGKSLAGCAVASESPALEEIGMEIVRDVKLGEIIVLEKQGFTKVGQIISERVAHCAFEWAYIARIDSVIDGVAVKQVRNNLGAKLAKGDDVEGDIVASIPLSGIGHAQGYHHASNIPYDDVFLYNRYSDRSYTPLEEETRNLIAAEKLSLIHEAIKGKRIILCDDSIVRGTQMRKQILRLKAAGAKEVHIRVASPPLMAPCCYGISTRSYEELIARRHSIEEIRKMLGADTLRYNTLDDFVAAIGLSKEQLCLSCWTDEYPL